MKKRKGKGRRTSVKKRLRAHHALVRAYENRRGIAKALLKARKAGLTESKIANIEDVCCGKRSVPIH